MRILFSLWLFSPVSVFNILLLVFTAYLFFFRPPSILYLLIPFYFLMFLSASKTSYWHYKYSLARGDLLFISLLYYFLFWKKSMSKCTLSEYSVTRETQKTGDAHHFQWAFPLFSWLWGSLMLHVFFPTDQ